MTKLSTKNILDQSIRLCELFGFKNIEDVQLLYEGYKAQNFIIQADNKQFFLKVYCRIGNIVHQIKQAEQFFCNEHVPVICAIKDKHGRDSFCIEQEWCSLFPYIEARSCTPDELTDAHLIALGHLTSRVHAVGAYATFTQFDQIYFWPHHYFFWEYEELMEMFNKKTERNTLDELMMKTLQEKHRLIQKATTETVDIKHSHPVLIHGDLIYQNVFWNDHAQITHVFDFEKTCVGPRAYEFARSMMINCFDESWGDEQFRRASVFLGAYLEEIDFSFEEFLSGVRMYWMNMLHMTWQEAKYVFGNKAASPKIYLYHASRISHMHEDPELFCKRIYPNR